MRGVAPDQRALLDCYADGTLGASNMQPACDRIFESDAENAIVCLMKFIISHGNQCTKPQTSAYILNQDLHK